MSYLYTVVKVVKVVKKVTVIVRAVTVVAFATTLLRSTGNNLTLPLFSSCLKLFINILPLSITGQDNYTAQDYKF